jgi:hypothetical protein
MSFFAKLFGLNQKTTAQEDVALKPLKARIFK